MGLFLFLAYLCGSLTLAYQGRPSKFWEIGSAAYLVLASLIVGFPFHLGLLIWLVIIAIIVILRVESVRTMIGHSMFNVAVKSIPKLSKTEEEALNCGDVWFEKGIFIGEPDWEKLASIKVDLTAEEQSFLDNETETLCSMLDDWEITQQHDLPANVWSYMKEKGFFALVIAKEFGGKGFSARAHSDIVVKISSRSSSAAVTVMVPNSLGPGELLHHYGTEEQKTHFLPRLAKGIDIPCFALTEPGAGSDATSIESEAIVVHKKINEKMVLGLQLTLNKRWITLAPIATLVGLAVNLKDPHGLLKGIGEEGITCLLIPRDTPNLEMGNCHLPGGQAFMNGTIHGKDIFVPIDCIIGGQKKAGCGWHMLVECLSIGRSVSLPALATGISSMAYVMTGAFARIRRQFNVNIAEFEGVQEKLAEIAGLNYLANATRELTYAAICEGKKPSVASAIAKYFNTEIGRITLNHAMDIHGGRTVVLGPRNYLANFYQGIPISITVEGANIMTRNLLIFGQGSMACHPFIRDEFYAIAKEDKAVFQSLLWKHVAYFTRNFAKTICSAWTGGRLITVPHSPLKREYQHLSRLSFAYAWLADLSLMILGGDLKRKERLSARLADGMSYLYMAMAVLRHAQDQDETSMMHAKWAVTYCFHQAQTSLIALCENFPRRSIGIFMRFVAFPWGRSMSAPKDKLGQTLAKFMCENTDYRKRTIKNIAISDDPAQATGRMEYAFQLLMNNRELYKKVPELKRCPSGNIKIMLAEKVSKHELTQSEMDTILLVEQARWEAIQVDEFTPEEMKKLAR